MDAATAVDPLSALGKPENWLRLALSAEARTKSRSRIEMPDGTVLFWQLPRGTVLRAGDRLQTETGDRILSIEAQPEPVLTVTTPTPLALMQAAYHLGNRHVPVEIAETYLRFAPDPVLRQMLEQRGLTLVEEIVPFFPETGAYGHGH